MRVSKSDDPFTLGTIDCGYCAVKFDGNRCISTSVVPSRRSLLRCREAETELLCVSIIAGGMLSNGHAEFVSSDALDIFRKIKKEIGK